MRKQSIFDTIIGSKILLVLILFVAIYSLRPMLALVTAVDEHLVLPSTEISIIPALILALGAYATGVIIIACWHRTFNALLIFSFAFWLRIGLGYLLGFIFLYDDERGMHWWSREVASAWMHNDLSIDMGLYPSVVAVLYFVFSPNILLPKTLNALIGSLLPFFVYDLAHLTLGNKRVARTALYITAFAPPLVIYSGVNLKEIITSALMILSFWFYLRIKPRFLGLIGCVASLIILLKFRVVYGGLIIPGILFLIILAGKQINWRNRRERRILFVGVSISVAVGLALISLPSPIYDAFYGRITSTYADEKFQYVASNATVGQFLVADQKFAPQNVIILILRTLLSPHPLRFIFDRGIGQLIESSIMTTWYILLPLAFIGFWHNRSNVYVLTWALVVFVGIVGAGFAAYMGGDPYRHRIALFPFLYLLSVDGILQVKQYKGILRLWFLVVIAFTGLYLVLRI